jgi:hypothetical protein
MADQPTRNRGGRPRRAQASAKALAGLVIDPMTVDPKLILAQIMVDTSAPAAARVSAAKALLADRERGDGAEGTRHDADLSRRAIALMRRVTN